MARPQSTLSPQELETIQLVISGDLKTNYDYFTKEVAGTREEIRKIFLELGMECLGIDSLNDKELMDFAFLLMKVDPTPSS